MLMVRKELLWTIVDFLHGSRTGAGDLYACELTTFLALYAELAADHRRRARNTGSDTRCRSTHGQIEIREVLVIVSGGFHTFRITICSLEA